jgi:hypothetical protein
MPVDFPGNNRFVSPDCGGYLLIVQALRQAAGYVFRVFKGKGGR